VLILFLILEVGRRVAMVPVVAHAAVLKDKSWQLEKSGDSIGHTVVRLGNEDLRTVSCADAAAFILLIEPDFDHTLAAHSAVATPSNGNPRHGLRAHQAGISAAGSAVVVVFDFDMAFCFEFDMA
jgi:hypothetical protein